MNLLKVFVAMLYDACYLSPMTFISYCLTVSIHVLIILDLAHLNLYSRYRSHFSDGKLMAPVLSIEERARIAAICEVR